MKDIKIRTIILMWVVCMMVIGTAIGLIPYEEITEDDTFISIIMLVSIVSMLTMILIVGRVKLKYIKGKIIEFKEQVSFKEIFFLILLGMIFSIGMGSIIEGIIYLINPEYVIEMLKSNSESINGIGELISYLILIVFLVPILEEVVFRRIFFVRLSKRWGIISGMIISSIIFGIIHNSFGIISATVFGVICCILYLKYKNLIANISLHILNNGIVGIILIAGYFNGTINEVNTVIDVKSDFISGIPLTIIASIMFIIYFRKNKKYLV